MTMSTRLYKQPLLIIIFLWVSFFLYGEKWVGQCATYQLLEGTKTEAGEAFDRNSYSAACNGFRLGSEVDVVNVKNGKVVTVKINNRITSESKYFILLTPQAARDIDMEWETGLVVINADFSDVNSTDILPINGLVAEGSFDDETVKQFPSITWPSDKGEDIVLEQETIPDEKPQIADRRSPREKEEMIILIDEGGPLIKAERKEKQEKDVLTVYPEMETKKYPRKIMQLFVLDEDAVIVLENGQIIEPFIEKQAVPQKIVRITSLDDDVMDKHSPGSDDTRKPGDRDILLDSDSETTPDREKIKSPREQQYALDSDEMGNPQLDRDKSPREKQYTLDSDDLGNPQVERDKSPREQQYALDSDDMGNPQVEREKVPRDVHYLLDSDQIGNPLVESTRYPEHIQALLDSDYQDGPLEERLRTPQQSYQFLLSPDGVDGPEAELIKKPNQYTRLLDSDLEMLPDEEKKRYPEQEMAFLSDDKEAEKILITENPATEDVKSPRFVPTQFDNDFDNLPDIEKAVKPEYDYYTYLSDDGVAEIIKKIEEELPALERIKNPALLYARLSSEPGAITETALLDYPADEKKERPRDKEDPLSGDYDVTLLERQKEEPGFEKKERPRDKESRLSGDYEVALLEKQKEEPGSEKKERPRDKESRLSGDYEVTQEKKEEKQERTLREDKKAEPEQVRKFREERRAPKKEEYVEGEVRWVTSLKKGALYIRLYTSFDKEQASSKLAALRELLPGVIGLYQEGKYIIFYGPVAESKASAALEGIRSYGFRDAYIIRM